MEEAVDLTTLHHINNRIMRIIIRGENESAV